MANTELVAVPRRGTPNFRSWVFRALTIGLLPVLTVACAMLATYASDKAFTDDIPFFADLTGFLLFVLVLLLIAGILALFDRRTRFSGAATIVLAIVLSPAFGALARFGLGL